jgi:hypothetical protein
VASAGQRVTPEEPGRGRDESETGGPPAGHGALEAPRMPVTVHATMTTRLVPTVWSHRLSRVRGHGRCRASARYSGRGRPRRTPIVARRGVRRRTLVR